MTWGKWCQVRFASDKTQVMVISRSEEDTRQLHGKRRLVNGTIPIQASVNILGVLVDSQLRFDRYLENCLIKLSKK